MDRKEFLTLLGLGAGAAFTGCLVGCKKDSAGPSVPAATTVDFTLDLTDPANVALTTNGGYLYKNGVIVARTTAGSIVAVSQFCTHEGKNIRYLTSVGHFFCPEHEAEFNLDGSVAQRPTQGSASTLKVYVVTESGNSVHVKG